MVEEKLKRLEQNLEKGNELLDRLQELCDKQLGLFDNTEMEAKAFDECMDEQDALLQELITLNEETDEIYASLHSEIISSDSSYIVQVARLQKLISQIVDKTSSLQNKEQSKKQKMDDYFERERKNFGDGRKTSKAALDYYKSMSRSSVITPQFMDQKK